MSGLLVRTSEKGRARVDYDRTLWVPCPPVMPDGYDTARWAREFSEAWWEMYELEHGEIQLKRLAAQLALVRDFTFGPGEVGCHLAFLHLPDPRRDPLPVYLAILAADGEKNARLRGLTLADDPDVLTPPVVEEFTTDRLGTGLRVLRHFPGTPGPRTSGPGTPAAPEKPTAVEGATEIHAGLSYAWRNDEYQTDLRLFTATHDLGRLRRAIPDIDDLARQITVLPAS